MTLGAEPKKVAVLGVLVVGIFAAWYWNSSGDSSTPAPAPAPRNVSDNPATVNPAPSSPAPPRTRTRVANTDYTARVPGSRPDDHIDPKSIDPKLQLDLLAKVQAVPPIEGGRNLFQFASAPVPDKPLPKVPDAPHIAINQPQPKPTTNVLSTERPGPPPAPPINLKYYGYTLSKSDGRKKAMLLDGDDIFLAVENQTVKQRYRIVRIATTSIDIEDTQFKSTQTLKIQEPPT
jgi:hypothetical protein